MRSVGIIAEYNPFHNGHLYHINKIKELEKDAVIVLVMSGNFTQRGDVAIIDKWKRCEIAIKAGVDLVVELPFPFATQSADYFSYGAITILEKLKVDKLIFGSESDDINTLEAIANCQIREPDFDKLVKVYSKFGYNYPTAISSAIKDLTGKEITTPNDLLGVSYIKTIKQNNYNIKAETIKRTNDYHSKDLDDEISSASAIRKAIKSNVDINKQVPAFSLDYMSDFHTLDDYFPYLKYKIITEKDLSIYNTVDEGLDKALKKAIENSFCINDLIMKLKSKRYTYNKISRMLLHILCNYTKEKNSNFRKISYIRILGFNELGKNYLNTIKKEIDIPIISKIKREKDEMLEFEIDTTKIYSLILPQEKQLQLIEKEFKNKLYKNIE